jgi:hypothetical protein
VSPKNLAILPHFVDGTAYLREKPHIILKNIAAIPEYDE